jgi:hypothetical protein
LQIYSIDTFPGKSLNILAVPKPTQVIGHKYAQALGKIMLKELGKITP